MYRAQKVVYVCENRGGRVSERVEILCNRNSERPGYVSKYIKEAIDSANEVLWGRDVSKGLKARRILEERSQDAVGGKGSMKYSGALSMRRTANNGAAGPYRAGEETTLH